MWLKPLIFQLIISQLKLTAINGFFIYTQRATLTGFRTLSGFTFRLNINIHSNNPLDPGDPVLFILISSVSNLLSLIT